MKQNNLLEYKDLDVKSLSERVALTKKEMQDLLLDKNMNNLKDLKSLDKKRKEIAKMLTIRNQKNLIAKLEGKEEKK